MFLVFCFIVLFVFNNVSIIINLRLGILHFSQDRESKLHAGHHRYGIDEEFSGRIKNIEHKLKGSGLPEKKPRDLLRAIGLLFYNFIYYTFYIF